MALERLFNLIDLSIRKSFFSVWPQSNRETNLIKRQLSEIVIGLLDSRFYLRLLGSPHDLESIIASEHKHVD